jgi:6-phosphogluconate dehydrogenase
MEIGFAGLGRMGGNMARRLARAGVRVHGYDRNPDIVRELADEGVLTPAASLIDLAHRLPAPRIVWLMVPAGAATELAVQDLWPELARGDLLIDGGNANYKESQRRASALTSAGIHFIDCGVSGGVWGKDEGYALMFGGAPDAARMFEPYARLLAPAPDRGWLHCGPAGSGHFVKMIHNGIEYGMMQAYAEGFALMKGRQDLALDLGAIAETWRHGSVVRSWLLDLTASFLRDNPSLEDVAPIVADSGEGRWTVNEAIEQGVAAPVLALAMMSRFASQGSADYANRMLAKMRNAFGGHAVETASRDRAPES